ncbi:MAG: site-specific DNA-methyltransferase [Flavobacterium sp.]|nr:site-specific DNA-methyltransferase [Flavobacterium sp.]
MLKPHFKSEDKNFYLLQGDCKELLPQFEHKFDMVFADPPYFLSNNGLSIQSGQIVSVNKGTWDKSEGFNFINDFNRTWLKLVREKLKDNGTIWISGTYHNIFSIGQLLQELDFKILNVITWEKNNPPPNFSCRFFTHSAELIIWARKKEKVPHYYNYELMKQLNGDKQMKDVWKLPAIARWEKSCGKHPTQKPLAVLTRLILASTKPNAWILDPFAGSSTTGIAANLLGRRYLGIDMETEFLEISKNRKLEIENVTIAEAYCKKINGFETKKQLELYLTEEPKPKELLALGYIRSIDLKKLTQLDTFYFHATDKQNNFIDFPYDLYNAKKLVIYSGGRAKPFYLTSYYGEIESIKHKHKSKIRGKEKSKTTYYFEVKLKDTFTEDISIENNMKIKNWINEYKSEYELNKVDYLPILTLTENVF